MKQEMTRPRSLREIESEVEAEGREWTRQRLQQRLQEEAQRPGNISPLSGLRLVHRRTRPMQLRTVVGAVQLEVLHGQDPGDKHWGCPIREHWGLTSHQQLSLALEDKLAFTVTATDSYAEAAAVAGKWGVSVDDSTLHALTQRLGAKAEVRTQEALKTVPAERQPDRAPTPLAILMLDGWQVRQRGPGWGKKKTKEKRDGTNGRRECSIGMNNRASPPAVGACWSKKL